MQRGERVAIRGLNDRFGAARRWRAVWLAAGVVLAVVATASVARADCTPAAANGVTATCSGTTTNQGGGVPGTSAGNDGYGTGNETGVTVNINAGSTVTGANSGINLNGATVTNNVGASITGALLGIRSYTGSANVTNFGSIAGGNGGVYAGNVTLINNAGASITGNSGVWGDIGFANVTNSGSITGIQYGILARAYSIMTNNAGGSISGGLYGIIVQNSSASITNSGSITSGDYAIRFSSGAGGSSVFNAGTISGGIAAIQFAGTGNTLTLAPGSAITGNVLGTGSDTFQLGGTGSATFDMSQFGAAAQYRGFGTFNKVGSSTWTLTGTSSYSGATNILAGTLLASGSLSPDSAYTIAAGATLALDSPFQFIGSLAGAGSVTNANAADAVLVVGLNNSSTTFAGVIKDGVAAKMSLWIDGTGVTTLTGTNTYTGGTSICFCSTLQIGNGGTTGSIVGDVINGGTLIFNRSNFYSFDGSISDDGADQGKLVKTGAGNTVLSGINTYTGTTTVDAGTLSVNGSIASSSLTTVNSGGTLGGNGFVGDTLINGGVLAPGNSIGTLTVSGSLTMTAASTYLVQISAASSDKTIVTGTATLAGKVAVDPLARIAATTTYTILTAGTISGSFDTTTVVNNFARNARLSYVGNDVLLTVDPGLLSPNLPDSASRNQKAVATAIDNALTGGGTMPGQFNALFALTGDALRNALTQISGETATGSQQTTFNAMTQFMGMMTDPFSAGRGFDTPGAMGYADARKPRDAFAMFTKAPPRAPSYDPRWSVWASGFGGSQTTDGNAATGSNTARSSIGGIAVGADVLLSPNTIAGFSLAGGGTNFSVANGGSGHSDIFQAGAFVRHSVSSAYITAAAAYGWQDITTDRIVTVAGLDRLHAQFNANSYSARVEGGNRYVSSWLGGIGLTPYAAAQVIAFDLPSYAETVNGGASTFALNYAGKTVTSTRSELGLRSDKSFAVADAILTLRGRAAWAHDYNSDRGIAATFQSLPGASFTVSGAAPARDAALTTASAEMAFISGLSLAATFEGEFSDVTRSYAGKGTVRYHW
jgi:autotransporter-associated beta strand protein